MIKLRRPTKPGLFDEHVKKAKADIQTIIDSGREPLSAEFVSKWKKFKPHFARAQCNKCAYCELDAIAGQPGDVEHYAPKTNVGVLKARGIEEPNSASVTGRIETMVSARGYWWQAYEWSNYLLSCDVCNRAWKGNLFPCQEPAPSWPPSEADPNTPLLINPFGPGDPTKHLTFTKFGAIVARDGSPQGRATIDVCGLDRIALTSRRRNLALRVFSESQDLVRAATANPPNLAEASRIARSLLFFGDRSEVHCGMVRSIVKDETKLSWTQIRRISKVT